jgi:hypothetical protein
MKKIRDSWVVTTERKSYSREGLRFAAQAKIYYDDGTSSSLHEHSGETKSAAEKKAQAELDQYISQHA